ncbi:cysteine peptidase family C39 domain-containing protein [Bacteroides cellulosilyticus]|jgi:hypothetical protein|uniref:cysteine peptidase family C39 domain-containing protein n=3 Tax=Bacteroides cellulosilyticus TaxID=246787 RepID=UPI000760236C|nr:cysteine peptidase family C39 domain-containing protein [Bacteroides cellulosilyticus]MBX9085440.1 hypothetical protein [Bacteroides cellulosilyticus]
MESTLFVVLRFIDRYKILYDKEEIRLRLMSDPQFPSLLSIANILDYLHISYKPVQTSLLTLETFKLDCLVHLKNNHHSSFAIIESMRNDMVTYYDGDIHTISTKDFEERWSKIAILVTPPISQQTILSNHKRLLYAITSIILGALLIFIKSQSFLWVIPAFVCCIGILLSFQLMQIEADKNHYSKFCQVNSKINCRKVVIKPLHIFSYHVSLAECNFIVYVAALASCLLASKETIVYIQLYISLFSLCLLPLLVLLVAYQLFVLKHWCLLCLCLSSIYIMMGCCFIYYRIYLIDSLLFYKEILSIFFFSLFLALVILQFSKKHLNSLAQYKREKITFLRFKRNQSIIQQFLCEKDYIDLDYENAILLGDQNSSITIATIISPYCPYCKAIVKEMFNLSNAFPIKWNIIWDGIISLQNQHINNQQLYWEELYKTDKWTFIRELQKFTKKEDFLLPSCNVSEQTKLLFYNRLNLLKQSNIDKNPTVLINGRILSEYYSVSDFKYILNDILETNEI